MMNTHTPEEAIDLFVRKQAPEGMHINGHVDLTGKVDFTLPANLYVKRLTLDRCYDLETLPAGLRCYELSAQSSNLRRIPADLQVEYKLDLTSCTKLTALPSGLKVGSLVLRGCENLVRLPDDLDVYFLDLQDCAKIKTLPESVSVKIGRLNLRGCNRLRSLPAVKLSQLDVSGCSALTALPDGMRVSSWLDVANTPLTELPPSLQGVRLRWRDVMVDERIVFHPETITATEILNESNAEVRRVMLDRKGYEAFLAEAESETMDEDTDAGGTRRLLRVPLAGDEPLMCLAVLCPSTAHQYLLRVPPTMRTCHEAAAWIAGVEPEDYFPIAET